MATLTQPTLNKLITEIRIQLNQRDPDNSYWADDELTLYINDATRFYFQMLNEYAEGQFDTSTTLDLVSGTETVSLPSDFFEIKSIYYHSGDDRIVMRYANNINESYSVQNTGTGDFIPSYYFRGNSIVLRPIPNSDKSPGLTLEYTRFPEEVIWGTDSLPSGISAPFKEMIVTYAIYKAKVKESASLGVNTYQGYLNHLDILTKQFKETATMRSKYPQFVKPFIPEGGN